MTYEELPIKYFNYLTITDKLNIKYLIMHAFLLVGEDGDSFEEKLSEITKKNTAKILEFPLSKISDVRDLERFTSRSHGKTVIVTRDIDKSTSESLNAFLKNLEEPNPNIIYVLTAENINNILPTIISRCEVIKVGKNNSKKLDDTLIKKFLNGGTGIRFSIIDKIKKKEEALNFTKNLITYLHLEINKIKDKHFDYLKVIKIIHKTHNAISLNGNVSLQLTNLVVSLDKKENESI